MLNPGALYHQPATLVRPQKTVGQDELANDMDDAIAGLYIMVLPRWS
jgi:hypothetical protein